jgi:phospholipid/cholesterol/gamma-HCH transport system permease protein
VDTGVVIRNPEEQSPVHAPWPLGWIDFLGRGTLEFARSARELVAFALITFGVTLTEFNRSGRLVHPLVRVQIHRAGLRLLPMVSFLAAALGVVIIGQTVSLLTRVGVESFAGTVMVTVVVRELGPIAAAMVVLTRAGTASVVELGLARALGEVDALEALGIDPVHYLIVPRVIGLALAVFSLTVYFIVVTLVSGFLFAFVQDVPLLPGAYFRQLAAALTWQDFVLFVLKTCAFGGIIAVVTCYHGLARPLRPEQVSRATSRAVVQCIIACVSLDTLFIVAYLLM